MHIRIHTNWEKKKRRRYTLDTRSGCTIIGFVLATWLAGVPESILHSITALNLVGVLYIDKRHLHLGFEVSEGDRALTPFCRDSRGLRCLWLAIWYASTGEDIPWARAAQSRMFVRLKCQLLVCHVQYICTSSCPAFTNHSKLTIQVDTSILLFAFILL